MKFFTHLLLLTLLTGTMTYADRGGHSGNGGDDCEKVFLSIRSDLNRWIRGDGYKRLDFESIESPEEYREKMLGSIETAKMSCTNRKIFIDGAEKTCKNIQRTDGSHQKIICNSARFLNPGLDPELSSLQIEDAQYTLVHHEYAGLAGFEKTGDYHLTKQLSSRMNAKTIRMLNIISERKKAKPLDTRLLAQENEIESLKSFFETHPNDLSFPSPKQNPKVFLIIHNQRTGKEGSANWARAYLTYTQSDFSIHFVEVSLIKNILKPSTSNFEIHSLQSLSNFIPKGSFIVVQDLLLPFTGNEVSILGKLQFYIPDNASIEKLSD